jgi:hypothetical protein
MPEMPASEVREGDTVTIVGLMSDYENGFQGYLRNSTVTVTRPVSPQAREVAANDGDELWQMTVARDVLADLLRDEMATTRKLTAELECTRPVSQLPDKPGAVIRCEIRHYGIVVAESFLEPDGFLAWRSIGHGAVHSPDRITRVITVLDHGQST